MTTGSPKVKTIKRIFENSKSFYDSYQKDADSILGKKSLFRGQYTLAMPSITETPKKNRVALLKKFFEKNGVEELSNLTTMKETAKSCPVMNKIVPNKPSLKKSPSFGAEKSFFSHLPKNILMQLSPCSSPKKSTPKSTNSSPKLDNFLAQTPRFKLFSSIMSRKSIGIVKSPIKSVKEIRKNFSPSSRQLFKD